MPSRETQGVQAQIKGSWILVLVRYSFVNGVDSGSDSTLRDIPRHVIAFHHYRVSFASQRFNEISRFNLEMNMHKRVY